MPPCPLTVVVELALSIGCAPYRVLSIDGGGVRGLYSALVLHGIAQRIARGQQRPDSRLDIGAQFNLILGTSTGAIIAAALSAGVALEDVVQMYQRHAACIFRDPAPSGSARLLLWLGRQLRSAANRPEPLGKALTEVLGNESLAGLFARRGIALCIPAVDMHTQKSWVFKTPHDTRRGRLQRDNHYRLVDVVLASTAAPIVLPLAGLNDPNSAAPQIKWFADGGLWANNPVLCALVEALEFAPPEAPIHLISVSTCPPFKVAPPDARSADRGLLEWRGGVRALEAAIDAQAHAYDYMTKTLVRHIGGRRIKYVRLCDPRIDPGDACELRLDNPACLPRLSRLAAEAVDLNMSAAAADPDGIGAIFRDTFGSLTPLASPISCDKA